MTYDEWKTTNPADEELGEREPGCTCARTRRSRRDCPVHGIDPDAARDDWLDRRVADRDD